jgi:hypothetical protein
VNKTRSSFTAITILWTEQCGGTTGGRTNAPEATVSGLYNPQYVAGVSWKSPVNNKLYIEGGVTRPRTNSGSDATTTTR